MDDDFQLNITGGGKPKAPSGKKPAPRKPKKPRLKANSSEEQPVQSPSATVGAAAVVQKRPRPPTPAATEQPAKKPRVQEEEPKKTEVGTETPVPVSTGTGSRKNPIRVAPQRVPMLVGDGNEDDDTAAGNAPMLRSSHLWQHTDTFAGLHLCDDVVTRLTADVDAVAEHPVARKGLGLTTPTLVQRVGIPAILSGRDALIRAETGSGKTLAFLLPMVDGLVRAGSASIRRSDGTRAILLAPTRELATQIHSVLSELVRPFPWIVPGILSGGEKRKSEKARLRKGVTLLVATPGRLMDHLRHTESFILQHLQWVVLDEADRFLEMGFETQLRDIFAALAIRQQGDMPPGNADEAKEGKGKCVELSDAPPGKWQTVLLSATLSGKLRTLAGRALHDPIVVDGNKGVTSLSEPRLSGAEDGKDGGEEDAEDDEDEAEGREESEHLHMPRQLTQVVLPTPIKWRLVTLLSFLRYNFLPPVGRPLGHSRSTKIIAFFSSCDSVDFHFALLHKIWAHLLQPSPIGAGSSKSQAPPRTPAGSEPSLVRLHGNVPQTQRQESLQAFMRSDRGLLLATDVAARGLDLPRVDTILQMDPPSDVEEYVHRAGRTARRGEGGRATLCLAPHEEPFADLLRDRGLPIQRLSNLNVLAALRFTKIPISLLQLDDGENGRPDAGASTSAPGRRDAASLKRLLHSYDLNQGNRGNKKSKGWAEKSASVDVEMAGVRWQVFCEELVARDPELSEQARQAFLRHVGAYACHSKSMRHIFHPRALHLGHLAKAFGLADPPSRVASKAPSAAAAAADGKHKSSPLHSTGAGKGGGGKHRAEKDLKTKKGGSLSGAGGRRKHTLQESRVVRGEKMSKGLRDTMASEFAS